MAFSGFGDLNPEFSNRLQMFVAASGGRISITSGFRSVERQQQLWDAALKKYGDPEVADNWVARPGKSHHNKGIAADLGFADAGAREWAHSNAARFGLYFPMEWEPWHIEPSGVQASADPGAYTTPPAGHENPASAAMVEDPHDPAVQMGRLMGAMLGGQTAPEGQSNEVVAAPTQPEGVGSPERQLNQVAGGMASGS
jgi:hypothetical protein